MENQAKSTGVSFGGLLTITFIILKLTGNIDWSWWCVLSPVWIPILLVAIILIVWYYFFKRT